MLGILASSFRIATRTDVPPVPVPDREVSAARRNNANLWFWQGRRWAPPRDVE